MYCLWKNEDRYQGSAPDNNISAAVFASPFDDLRAAITAFSSNPISTNPATTAGGKTGAGGGAAERKIKELTKI